MIREMRYDDIYDVHLLHYNQLNESYSFEIFKSLIDRWPSGQLVYTDFTGKIIAHIGTEIGIDGGSHIMYLSVDTFHKGKGIGTLLMERFKTISRMNNCRHISLEVKTSNVNGIKFYKKNGFIIVGNVPPGFYKDSDGYVMDCFL